VFQGADVEGLQGIAAKCEQGGDTADQVVAFLTALVIALKAASWFTGGASAAYAAYLESVVIPWLKKVSMALHLFAKVLNAHADAQTQASAGESVDWSSLPTYQTPQLPAGDCRDYPVLPPAGTTVPGYAGTPGQPSAPGGTPGLPSTPGPGTPGAPLPPATNTPDWRYDGVHVGALTPIQGELPAAQPSSGAPAGGSGGGSGGSSGDGALYDWEKTWGSGEDQLKAEAQFGYLDSEGDAATVGLAKGEVTWGTDADNLNGELEVGYLKGEVEDSGGIYSQAGAAAALGLAGAAGLARARVGGKHTTPAGQLEWNVEGAADARGNITADVGRGKGFDLDVGGRAALTGEADIKLSNQYVSAAANAGLTYGAALEAKGDVFLEYADGHLKFAVEGSLARGFGGVEGGLSVDADLGAIATAVDESVSAAAEAVGNAVGNLLIEASREAARELIEQVWPRDPWTPKL
jgi:hypothetical protein